MLFDRSVRRLDKDLAELEDSGIRVVMDLSRKGNEIETDAAFLNGLLSKSPMPFFMSLRASGEPGFMTGRSGFLIGKGIRLLSGKRGSRKEGRVLHSEKDSVVSLSVDSGRSDDPYGIEIMGKTDDARSIDLFFSGLSEGLEGQVKVFASGKEISLESVSQAFGKLLEEMLGNQE